MRHVLGSVLSAALLAGALLVGCGGGAANGEPASGSTTSANNARASNSQGASAQDRADFVAGCTTGCLETSTPATCASYCDCMASGLAADDFAARVTQMARLGDALMSEPFFQQLNATCGPQFVDDSFVSGCAEDNPGMRAFCFCAVEQLRSGMTREQGTLWILQNPDLEATPEGRARLEHAQSACAHLVQPAPAN